MRRSRRGLSGLNEPTELVIADDVPPDVAERYADWFEQHETLPFEGRSVLCMLRGGEMNLSLRLRTREIRTVVLPVTSMPEELEERLATRNLVFAQEVPLALVRLFQQWFVKKKWQQVKVNVEADGQDVRVKVRYTGSNRGRSYVMTGTIDETPAIMERRMRAFKALGGRPALGR